MGTNKKAAHTGSTESVFVRLSLNNEVFVVKWETGFIYELVSSFFIEFYRLTDQTSCVQRINMM